MSTISFSWIKGTIPFLALIALSLSACGNKKTASTQPAEDDPAGVVLESDSIGWTDSISTPHGNKAYCRIAVEYPVEGNPELLDSLHTWIARQLSINCMITNDTIKPFTVPGATIDDGKKYIASIGRHVLDEALPSLLGLDSLGIDHNISYEYSWSINNIYDTENFVTYASSTYCYLGGAHGGSGFTPQVFRISDGRQFRWNMFRTDSLPALTSKIKQELMKQYFEVKTEAEFRDCLLVNPDTLPLPVTPPYFMADGVHFCYQQYEIAPYAAGMPGCILPYNVARPMLTPDAAALLPKD